MATTCHVRVQQGVKEISRASTGKASDVHAKTVGPPQMKSEASCHFHLELWRGTQNLFLGRKRRRVGGFRKLFPAFSRPGLEMKVFA